MTKKWSAVSLTQSDTIHPPSPIRHGFVSHRMTLLSFHTWRQTCTCPTTCGNAMPRLGGKVSLSNHSLQIPVVYRWSLMVITAQSLLTGTLQVENWHTKLLSGTWAWDVDGIGELANDDRNWGTWANIHAGSEHPHSKGGGRSSCLTEF